MKSFKIKVCGMKDRLNIMEVAQLNPDYLGFILYDRSPRYISPALAGELGKDIPASIQKTGVLVNEPLGSALRIASSGFFDILQLHGDENPEYCRKLSEIIRIMKAFRISSELPGNLEEYQPFCSMFLFDSAGKDYGGTGKKFDHGILPAYSLNTEFFLSGGISLSDSFLVKSINSDKMAGFDLNSRFEISPGIKDTGMLKKFMDNLRSQ